MAVIARIAIANFLQKSHARLSSVKLHRIATSLLFVSLVSSGCGDNIAATVTPDATRPDAPLRPDAPALAGIKHVFVIAMENHSWASIKGSPSAPYLNSLLSSAAHAENYKTPTGLHPSKPNYIWLEAGDNLGVRDSFDPGVRHFATTEHLVTLLDAVGYTWKNYAENIDGLSCPLVSSGLWAPRHAPFLYFDDVTNNNSATSANCIAHVRPYPELAGDLVAGNIANYNFITPNLCNDMHGALPDCDPARVDTIRIGDDWLATQVPMLLASAAYADHGAIFIVWDEGEEGAAYDGPIGMIVLSANVKPGYASVTAWDHSSFVRTMQDIFNVRPYLRGAATATNFSELFLTFP